MTEMEFDPKRRGRAGADLAGGGRVPAVRSGVVTYGVDIDDRGETDANFVTRVVGGDGDAFRPLVERYQRSVFGLVRRLVGPADAEDITQDAFVRAFQHLSGLKDRCRFGPWLFQIARSLCRDRLRRRETEKKALQYRMEMLRLESVPSCEGMGSALTRLPPEEFEVLHLRHFEGLTYDEIAGRMGLTFSKVDHLIRKARALLGRWVVRERRRERIV